MCSKDSSVKGALHLSLYSVIVFAVAFFAWDNSDHDEQDVIFSLIKHLTHDIDASSAAIYSYPSTCHTDESDTNKYNISLWENFHKVNRHENGPIQIFSLKGLANTIKWEDNLQIYNTEGVALRFRPTDKVLVKLSRVGFNKDKSEALICFEPTGLGTLFHLKIKNNEWVVLAENNVYVQ